MQIFKSYFTLFARILFAILLMASVADAGPTRVGNGDDGTDLESGKKVTSGILIETRADAMARIAKLNAQNVPGLGRLLVEIEKSEIFYVAHDVKPTAESGSDGIERNATVVFARTFPEPVAPTRFFAAALTLDREQLIALHIHEALHRALPPDLRENEATVSQLTLALAAPDSTHDRVQASMAKVLYANRFESEKVVTVTGDSITVERSSPGPYYPPQAAAPTQSTMGSIRETLGLDSWKMKRSEVKLAMTTSARDLGIPVTQEFLPQVTFEKFGPLGKTTFEGFWSLGTDTKIVERSALVAGPLGIRAGTVVANTDEGEISLEYRYMTVTPASNSFRAYMANRTIKEYGLRYQSKHHGRVRWNHFMSVIEGGDGVRLNMFDIYDMNRPNVGNIGAPSHPPDEMTNYGSTLTLKSAASIQVTGNVEQRRGLTFVPSLELVMMEPSARHSNRYSTEGVPMWADRQTIPETVGALFGLGIHWQGERFGLGAEAKIARSASDSSTPNTGDYWEHGFDSAGLSLNLQYAL